MTFTLVELGQRLREVPITRPDADSLTARVLRAQRAPVARTRPIAWAARPIAAALAGLLGLWGIFYFSPAAGATLASAPGVGSVSSFVLDRAGLGTGSSVTSLDAAATASGVTVHLIGASASPLRTVILYRVSPADYQPTVETLTDQFGTSYEERGGYGDMRTGDWALIFAPPSVLARPLGMRFTLTFTALDSGAGVVVGGKWVLSGTVLSQSGRNFVAPQPAVSGPMSISFTAGHEAAGVLELTAHLRGVTEDQLGLSQKQTTSEAPLTVTVLDSSGKQLEVAYGLTSEQGGFAIDITAFGASDHGAYTLRISVRGVGSVERTIVLG
jgi:hypothetical protein